MSGFEVGVSILHIYYNPRRTKFRKQHRGRMKGVSTRG